MLKTILYDWDGWNGRIFYAINGLHDPLFTKLMLLGTFIGMFKLFPVYFIAIAGYAYFDTRKKPEMKCLWLETLLVMMIAYLASLVWVHFTKNYFHFPRPFVILPEVNIPDSVRASEQPYVSFPSGHTAFVMLMAASLWPVLNCWGKALNVVYVLWVGVSRIALGAHFPADVVWSAVISLISVAVIRLVIRSFIRWKCQPKIIEPA